MAFDLEVVVKALGIDGDIKANSKKIKENYPRNSEFILGYLVDKQKSVQKKSEILKTILYSSSDLNKEIFRANSEKNVNFIKNIFEFIKSKNSDSKEDQIFKQISEEFVEFKKENPTKNLEFFSKNYEKNFLERVSKNLVKTSLFSDENFVKNNKIKKNINEKSKTIETPKQPDKFQPEKPQVNRSNSIVKIINNSISYNLQRLKSLPVKATESPKILPSKATESSKITSLKLLNNSIEQPQIRLKKNEKKDDHLKSSQEYKKFSEIVRKIFENEAKQVPKEVLQKLKERDLKKSLNKREYNLISKRSIEEYRGGLVSDRSVESYVSEVISSYKDFFAGNKKKNDKDILKELISLSENRKPDNLESLFMSMKLKDYNSFYKISENKDLVFLTNKNDLNASFDDKFKKNFKNFAQQNSVIQKINDSAKTSKDAGRIYELIAKTQKLETEKNIIEKLSKTDYLEKILYSLKDYKGKIGLTIKDLRNFLDSSIDPIETTRALINYYDSKGKIGKNYLDKFAFGQNLNTESETYADLEKERLVEVCQNVRKYSANLKIKFNENHSGKASAVLYKIDRENNIAYFLTNEHVVNNKNLKEVKFQLMNPDLKKQTGDAKVIGFSKDYDVGLIAIKLPNEDIEKMNQPEIYKGQMKEGDQIIVVGNSKGFGSEDFSTNVSFGEVNQNIIRGQINYNAPSFPGNSGSGVWNSNGELIGVHHSGMNEEYINKKDQKNYASAVDIKTASKIADNLIIEHELKNGIKNGFSSKKENHGYFTQRILNERNEVNEITRF